MPDPIQLNPKETLTIKVLGHTFDVEAVLEQPHPEEDTTYVGLKVGNVAHFIKQGDDDAD